MTRWRSALRLEATTVVRERFAHAAAMSALLWLTILLPMPPDLRRIVAPYVLLGDVTIVGFYFIGGAVFFEKQQRTLDAVICSPLRFWEYLSSKVAVLMALSLLVAVVVVAAVHGHDVHLLQLLLGVALGTLVMLLAGFITSLPFGSVSDWFLFATVPLAVAELPVLYLSGVWPNPVLYLLPTHGPLLLLGAAFDQIQLAPWQVVYAVCYPLACAVGLYGLSVRFFDRYVIQRPSRLR